MFWIAWTIAAAACAACWLFLAALGAWQLTLL